MTKFKIPPIYQNLIVGTLTGGFMAVYLRVLFMRSEGQWFWILFFLIGPLVGFLSGKERERVQTLSKEKNALAGDVDKIQSQLKQSAQKYDLMLENLSDAVFLTTQDGRLLLFNRALSLLSGYPSNQLRQMRLSQFMTDGGKADGQRDAWVDNGIHRYEDCWKTKTGGRIYVELGAKWLKIGGKQLILYSARDILRRKQTEFELKKQDVIAALKQKLQEIARSQFALYQKILSPQAHTVGLLKTVVEKYNPEKERIAAILDEWAQASKFIGNLMEKNVRDMESSRRTWDLNAVLEQELDYFQKLTALKEFARQTWYAPELPKVSAFGRDLSIAFGSMIKATLLSMEPPRRREISVTTHLKSNQILVEIKAPSAIHFYDHLLSVLDPGYLPDGHDQTQLADDVCQELFKSFGAAMRIEAGEGQGVAIRVQIKAQAGIPSQRAIHEPEPPPRQPAEEETLLL